MPLYRGDHQLPHQSQTLGRDLCGEDILRQWRGLVALGIALTDVEVAARDSPYRFLVLAPGDAAMNWTAFRTVEEFAAWRAAYAVEIREGDDLEPGGFFRLRMPADDARWLPLVERPA